MARRQLLLGLLLAGLALVLTLVGLSEPDTRRRDGDHVLWSFARADVVRVEVDAGDRQRVLAREDAGWTLDGTPADGLGTELVDALDEASRGLVVDVPPEEVGLDHPAVVRFDVGATRYDVEVGDRAPVGGRVYVRRPGGPVVAVYGGLDEAVAQALAP